MVNGSIPLLVQIMLAKTVAPLTEFECTLVLTSCFLSSIAASGGGVLPQRGAPAAVLAPARRLPAPRHHRRRLQRRTPLRRPVNEGSSR